MSWLIDGVWASRDNIEWDTEMSQVSHAGGMSKVSLPDVRAEPLSHFSWLEHRDREGEVTMWTVMVYGMKLTIFND